MIYILYFGNQHSARVAGPSTRRVDCVRCGCHFEYPVEVVGVGMAHSPFFAFEREARRKALERAEDDLARRLDTEVVPLACPECGDYQPDMIELLRRRRAKYPFALRSWMMVVYLIITCLAVGTVVGMVLTPNFTTTPLVAGFFLLIPWALVSFLLVPVFLVQGLRRKLYNPNAAPDSKRRAAYARKCVTFYQPGGRDRTEQDEQPIFLD